MAKQKPLKPTLDPEIRENQLISLAMDIAEQKLLDGTASSQLITEFVKRGSRKYRLENEKLKEENNRLRAQTEALQSARRVEDLFDDAIKAFRGYAGYSVPEEEVIDEDL